MDNNGRATAQAEMLKNSVSQCRQKIEQAKEQYRIETKDAYTRLQDVLHCNDAWMESTRERLRPVAFLIAQEKGIPPYNRHGYPKEPDFCFLHEGYVTLRWDADHPNDIVDFEVTFEDLYKHSAMPEVA